MKLIKVKKADAKNTKLRDLLQRDIDRFADAIYRGEGWILKADIVEQFHSFTKEAWRDPLLERELVAKEIVDLVDANSKVEVFNTLTEARKYGYDL